MPGREFIHSSADVSSMLLYALDCGFKVIDDDVQAEAAPRFLNQQDAVRVAKGVFNVFLPEWVYGPFEYTTISAGYDRGKYHLQRVNYAPIVIYFQGERIDQGRRRFGDCAVSSYRDWLELPAKVIREAPAATDFWFKRFVAHLSSGVAVRAGVHKYRICKGVIADPDAAQCLPPFDFISWGADVLRPEPKAAGRRKR